MILAFSLFIYVLSAVEVYKWMGRSYGPGGRWETLDPGAIDVFWIFCPVGNTVFVLVTAREKISCKGFSRKFFCLPPR